MTFRERNFFNCGVFGYELIVGYGDCAMHSCLLLKIELLPSGGEQRNAEEALNFNAGVVENETTDNLYTLTVFAHWKVIIASN